MFSNALTYHPVGTRLHNYSKLLAGQCDRIVELARCAGGEGGAGRRYIWGGGRCSPAAY